MLTNVTTDLLKSPSVYQLLDEHLIRWLMILSTMITGAELIMLKLKSLKELRSRSIYNPGIL